MSDASLRDQLFVSLQRLLPTRALSAAMYRVAEVRNPSFKNGLIDWFTRAYPINLAEAERTRVEDYANFNDFFTRSLRPGTRPQPNNADILSSPVDGTMSQFGRIEHGRLIQAKGHRYSAASLLADEAMAERFADGEFCTIYLAPYNYHRVHMPFGGKLVRWSYVPGRLFSVNPSTARALPGLFARNERMVAIFETALGPLAVVMVGALFVGGIETVWGGRLTPPHLRADEPSHFTPEAPLALERGAELGRFHMGSTVVLLAPRGSLSWDTHLAAAQPLRLGQPLALARTRPVTTA